MLVLCRRQISSFFAQQSIDWAERVIDSRETVTFRSDWVDSLYAKKRYVYFLFTKAFPSAGLRAGCQTRRTPGVFYGRAF